MPRFYKLLPAFWLALFFFPGGCGKIWNDPYPLREADSNILYTAFLEHPKHLDPAQSYTEDEFTFIAQIYRPPLQYHYLKHPYELIPDALETLPAPEFYDAKKRRLPANAPAEKVAESLYELKLKRGMFYQPHPAFALDQAGLPLYQNMPLKELADKLTPADFKKTGTREVKAADYIYQIKRLAHPHLHSPIFGMMAEKIVGLKELGEALAKTAQENPGGNRINLDEFPLEGVHQVDDYTWRIRLKGRYPQFLYWLAMPFFAPMPHEADQFFSQPGMSEKNMTLDWWPVGSGPYMLTENDPNRRMVLSRNPNFTDETYPCQGEEEDIKAGLLKDCGRALPLIETAVFTREKEAIPYWNKFLQGYYDASGITSDSFDQAVRINIGGDIALSDDMRSKGIQLLSSIRSSIFYLGFNMGDPVIGGLDEKQARLRQALSIALNQEEFISIFLNGRGLPGMNPLPPGIFGFEPDHINPYVYNEINGKPRRKSLEEAKRLLAESGWPNGRNIKTGEPLIIHLDTTSGGMGDKPRLDWMTRQFKGIGIQLVVRATDYNRLQDKLRKGATQLFFLGWNADYPDPENFFFLFSSKENTLKNNGENKSIYENPDYDNLFEKMKAMDNTPERLSIIRQMNRILQHDAPWIYFFHPKTFALTHSWLKNRKPNDAANNTLKYQRINHQERARLRQEWNPPDDRLFFPLLVALPFCLFFIIRHYRKNEQKTGLS